MNVFGNWCWTALVLVFGLTSPVARADWINPDSIPNPPSAVNSANSTPVHAGNLVTTQYSGLGLSFPYPSAIATLNGVSVWAPFAASAYLPSGPSSNGSIDYVGSVYGMIVAPISMNPTTVSSLSVAILGGSSVSVYVYGYGPNGRLLHITPLIESNGGVQNWTFTAPGIGSFFVGQDGASTQPWGVAAVSLSPAPSPEPLPEPTSLVLAGLGALGLATRLGWGCIVRIA